MDSAWRGLLPMGVGSEHDQSALASVAATVPPSADEDMEEVPASTKTLKLLNYWNESIVLILMSVRRKTAAKRRALNGRSQ